MNTLGDKSNSSQLFCHNGLCISKAFVCYGYDYCADSPYEENWLCVIDYVKCKVSGESVDFTLHLCNEKGDCIDGRDEQNCRKLHLVFKK